MANVSILLWVGVEPTTSLSPHSLTPPPQPPYISLELGGFVKYINNSSVFT